MAFKKERLEKIIEREIGDILFSELKNDKLKFVSITNVNLTNDLSIATVFYTIIGTPEQITATENDLLETKNQIRGFLGKRLHVKKIPELRFKQDNSYEQGKRIDEILKNLEKK